MKVHVFTPHYNARNRWVLEQFARACGGSVLDDRRYVPCDVMVLFGLFKKSLPVSHAKAELIRQHTGPIIFLERGFVLRGADAPGDRFGANGEYFSVGINGVGRGANFNNENSSPDRWQALGIDLKPWRQWWGDYDLVCGQVPWDTTVQDTDHAAWCRDTVRALLDHNRKVRFRPHPNMLRKMHHYGKIPCTVSNDSLAQDLSRADRVITYCSTIGVTSAIEGIPVVALSNRSMAWDVASHDIYTCAMPDRTQWAYDIAYAQWRVDEFEAAWHHVRGAL